MTKIINLLFSVFVGYFTLVTSLNLLALTVEKQSEGSLSFLLLIQVAVVINAVVLKFKHNMGIWAIVAAIVSSNIVLKICYYTNMKLAPAVVLMLFTWGFSNYFILKGLKIKEEEKQDLQAHGEIEDRPCSACDERIPNTMDVCWSCGVENTEVELLEERPFKPTITTDPLFGTSMRQSKERSKENDDRT